MTELPTEILFVTLAIPAMVIVEPPPTGLILLTVFLGGCASQGDIIDGKDSMSIVKAIDSKGGQGELKANDALIRQAMDFCNKDKLATQILRTYDDSTFPLNRATHEILDFRCVDWDESQGGKDGKKYFNNAFQPHPLKKSQKGN